MKTVGAVLPGGQISLADEKSRQNTVASAQNPPLHRRFSVAAKSHIFIDKTP
jgi:hypothetical protein